MEFISALDPTSLLQIHTAISLLTSAASISPSYNLPIILYGLYAQDKTDTYEPLRMFTGLLGCSFVFDIFWLLNNDPYTLVKVLIIINLLLKILTFLSLLLNLRQRGDRFGNAPIPDFSGNAQTIWTMPTPTGRGAYQSAGGDSGYDIEPGNKPLPSAPTHTVRAAASTPAPAAPVMPHLAPAPAQPSNLANTPPPGAFQI